MNNELFLLQYKATDFVAPGPGTFELHFTPASGGEKMTMKCFDFKDGGGTCMGMYNTDEVHTMFLPTREF